MGHHKKKRQKESLSTPPPRRPPPPAHNPHTPRHHRPPPPSSAHHPPHRMPIARVTGKRPRPAPPQRHRIHTGTLNGLPHRLQQQPLLRISRQRLTRPHPEESRIE